MLRRKEGGTANVLCYLFGSMFLMLLIGVPIGIALAGSMVCLLLFDPVTSMTFVTQAMYTSVGNFTLLALPFS